MNHQHDRLAKRISKINNMKRLPDHSASSVVTSPPYDRNRGLRGIVPDDPTIEDLLDLLNRLRGDAATDAA